MEDESDDKDDDEDDDRPDFDFMNARGNQSNYLDMNTGTLSGLIVNAKQEEKDEQKDIDDSEPWEHLKNVREDLTDGKIEDTVRSRCSAVSTLLLYDCCFVRRNRTSRRSTWRRP